MALLTSASTRYKGILVLCVVGLVAFAISTFFGKHGVRSLLEKRDDYEQLDRSVTQLQRDNVRLQERIHQLESDPRYIEKIARERLGLVKPGEVIYRLDAPGAQETPQK